MLLQVLLKVWQDKTCGHKHARHNGNELPALDGQSAVGVGIVGCLLDQLQVQLVAQLGLGKGLANDGLGEGDVVVHAHLIDDGATVHLDR